ncbi:MAG TPA: hypothetical protein VHA09_00375 [Nitrososphaera sp.]|nr:hypothetical protein [Nitrososphaera sp.]
MSIADVFDVGEGDTVADAWLTTVNLLDMLEHTHRVDKGLYDFAEARDKIAKVYAVAELHGLDDDKKKKCACGLSDAEHAILRRKVLTFFKLQLSNFRRFVV